MGQFSILSTYHHHLSASFSTYSLAHQLATMPVCEYCKKNYSCYESLHMRACHVHCFEVFEHPHSKTGRLITVQRNEKGLAICQCVSGTGQVCNKGFANQRTWYQHYVKDHGTDSWLVCVISNLMLFCAKSYYRSLPPKIPLSLSLLQVLLVLPLPMPKILINTWPLLLLL